MLVNGTFVTDPMPPRPILLIYGDSEFLAWRTAASDSQSAFLQQYSGYSVSVRSIGGSTVYDPTAPHNHAGFGMNDTANITSASTLPSRVLIAYGGNDIITTTQDQTNFQTAFQQMLQTPASVLTGISFEVLGILPTGSQTQDIRARKNTLIKAAIAATGLQNITFRDVEGWGLETGIQQDTADQTHANRSGSTKQVGAMVGGWLGGDAAIYGGGQATWAATERTLTSAVNITSDGNSLPANLNQFFMDYGGGVLTCDISGSVDGNVNGIVVGDNGQDSYFAGVGVLALAAAATTPPYSDPGVIISSQASVTAVKAQTDKLTFHGSVVKADVTELADNATAATALAGAATGIYVGSVTGASTTTTLIDSALTATDANAYNGRVVIFLSGHLKFEGATVSAYDPSTHKLTFRSPLTSTPGGGDQYVMPMMF